MKRLCLAFAGVLLAGCGGGSGASSAMSVPDQVPAAPPTGDAFTSAVIALVRSTPETTEPDDVDGAALAFPDSGEPVAVE